MTDAGLAHLPQLQKLKILDLDQTKVTPAGVKQLQQSLPNLEVRGTPSPAPPSPPDTRGTDIKKG